jgi:antitoxin YefM
MALHDLLSFCRPHTKTNHPNTPPIASPIRNAFATTVSPGRTAGQPGNTLASAIQRFSASWQRPSNDTTEVAGSEPMRQVPQLKPITLRGASPRGKACQRWSYPGGHGHQGAFPTAILMYSSRDNDMQVVSFSEARESFKAVLDRVETDADVTVITWWHAMEQAGRDELLVHRLIEPDQADAVD